MKVNYNFNIANFIAFALFAATIVIGDIKLQTTAFFLLLLFTFGRFFSRLLSNIVGFLKHQLEITRNDVLWLRAIKILWSSVERLLKVQIFALLALVLVITNIFMIFFCEMSFLRMCTDLLSLQTLIVGNIKQITDDPYFIVYVVSTIFLGFLISNHKK